MRKSKNSVLERLDKAIGGNQQHMVYDESLDSAIDERLNQLVDILKTNTVLHSSTVERGAICDRIGYLRSYSSDYVSGDRGEECN